MKLNKKEILDYQKNRHPYLMIDFAEEVIPGKSAKGYKDFTIYSKGNKENAEKIKASYLKRHSVRENWADYMTAGSLSRYILWNRPTIAQSIGVYLKTFNLKYKK